MMLSLTRAEVFGISQPFVIGETTFQIQGSEQIAHEEPNTALVLDCLVLIVDYSRRGSQWHFDVVDNQVAETQRILCNSCLRKTVGRFYY